MAENQHVPEWLEGVLNTVGSEEDFTPGFSAGAHTVKIGLAEAATDSKGRDIIKVFVMGENDEEGEATLWLHTEGGSKMAVKKVMGILVHSVPEDKKPTISEFGKRVFANVREPADVKEGLLKILNEKLIGKEAFIFADPQGKYDTTRYVDLWHYDQSKRTPTVNQETTVENTDPQKVSDDLFA